MSIFDIVLSIISFLQACFIVGICVVMQNNSYSQKSRIEELKRELKREFILKHNQIIALVELVMAHSEKVVDLQKMHLEASNEQNHSDALLTLSEKEGGCNHA